MSKKLNIYLCSQDENDGYDTYDSFVGAFENEEEARNTNPDGEDMRLDTWCGWCKRPSDVTVKLIGVAANGVEKGVITASFNAG